MSSAFIEKVKTSDLAWINIIATGKKELAQVAKIMPTIDAFDLRDIPPPLQRPKLMIRDNYLFLILNFPVYNRKTREISTSEVDFIINHEHLITINDGGRLLPLQELFARVQENKEFREHIVTHQQGLLLYHILDHLLSSVFPMLIHVSQDIDTIEQEIFSGRERAMVHELLLLKRNIVNFRKTMMAHQSVVKKLVSACPSFFPSANLQRYLESLVAHTNDIWDLLSSYKDTIDALHETNESLISFGLNETMKTYTIISVIIFAQTLIAALLGMHLAGTPLLDSPMAFSWVLLIEAATAIFMLVIFRIKRWF